MIVAIDFDGTICQHEFPVIGKLFPHAKKVINRLYDDGYTIIIWTCRDKQYLKDALDFLNENGIKFHKANENADGVDFTTSPKIYADKYIDDRSLGFNVNWHTIEQLFYPQDYLNESSKKIEVSDQVN